MSTDSAEVRYEVVRLGFLCWVIYDCQDRKLVKDGGGTHVFYFKSSALDHASSLEWQHNNPHPIHPYYDIG